LITGKILYQPKKNGHNKSVRLLFPPFKLAACGPPQVRKVDLFVGSLQAAFREIQVKGEKAFFFFKQSRQNPVAASETRAHGEITGGFS